MRSHDPKLFAKVVVLGQRIHMSSQAMLSLLSRITSGGKSKRDDVLKKQLLNSLKDLETCLKEFDLHTGIDMSKALERLIGGFDSLEKDDMTGLYNKLQKLYREDYLATVIGLSKQE
jgi:hypothetical protein